MDLVRCFVITVDCMSAAYFTNYKFFLCPSKIVDRVECYNFRSRAITFTFCQPSFFCRAFEPFFPLLGSRQRQFPHNNILGYLKKNFKDTNGLRGKSVLHLSYPNTELEVGEGMRELWWKLLYIKLRNMHTAGHDCFVSRRLNMAWS